ncbi:uncharacterized protein N7482_006291 [Penicillium canariense]|uniref:DUF2293 domain-containing protein n=1 Tax=Penicillium canariense TaxID=189055 RepID=A0A9W9I6I6_9EURO|nr:uncharacterized protein N7482_006291 [Penicillium canariense]KAJ5167510.1 hypothetical protein N7482_006291 [Penicillium canariense]
MAPSALRKVHRRRKVVRRRQGGVRKPTARTAILASKQGESPQAARKAKQPSKPRVPEADDLLEDCRVKTKESNQTVYMVFNKTGKRSLGIRVPSDIHREVLTMSKATASSRATAVKSRDSKFLAQGRELLQEQFPLMPKDTLDIILEHAFLKGSGRVGRTSTMSDKHKAQLAVEAHVRHKYTPYESMLESGLDRSLARKKVWDTVQAIRKAWEGDGAKKDECLTLRLA